MDLANLSHHLEGSNTLFHDWNFLLAVADLLNGNGGSASSVDDTLVVLHGDKSATLIEHTPVFFDQSCEARALLGLQVGQLKFLLQALAMLVFGIHKVKNQVVLVKNRGIKFLLPEKNTAINIMKEMVISIRFVREAAVIVKVISGFLLCTKGRFGHHLDGDGLSCGYGGQSRHNARPIHIQKMMQ